MKMLTLVPMLLVFALFAAACGDSDESSDDTRSRGGGSDDTTDESVVDDTTLDNTSPQDSRPEDTASADTSPEDTASADTSPEDTSPDDTASADTTPGSSDARALAVAAVVVLDGDPGDPFESGFAAGMEDCLAEAAEEDDDAAAALAEIGNTEPGDGLGPEAATLAANCVVDVNDVDQLLANAAQDGTEFSRQSAECVAELYDSPEVREGIAEALEADVTDTDPPSELSEDLFGCLSDDETDSLLDELGIEFADEAESDCVLAAIVSGADSTAVGEALARCGVFGRVYAAQVGDQGVDLSDETAACIDTGVEELESLDNAAVDAVIENCATETEFTQLEAL